MKNKRQDAILELISKGDVETQEELISKLADLGFSVTQATVSRDIRELKLVKVSSEKGGYKYVAPSAVAEEKNHIYNAAFLSSVKSVEAAMNIVVIRTFPGLAQAVAFNLDSTDEFDILGCVGGDDTIFAVTHTPEAALALCDEIRRMIGKG